MTWIGQDTGDEQASRDEAPRAAEARRLGRGTRSRHLPVGATIRRR